MRTRPAIESVGHAHALVLLLFSACTMEPLPFEDIAWRDGGRATPWSPPADADVATPPGVTSGVSPSPPAVDAGGARPGQDPGRAGADALPEDSTSPRASGNGACARGPRDYDGGNGAVTWYLFSQGSREVNCSYAITGRDPDVVAHVATGNGRHFAAMNTADYDRAAVCGACVEVVRDGSRKVVVTVVDQCPVGSNPKCKPGHLDLSQEAFKVLGTVPEGYLGTGNGGVVGRISWRYVPCPVAGGVSFRLKEGGNAYFNEVLVQGHRSPIARVEVQVDGRWVAATRQDYNYWRPPGGRMGKPPYRVRAWDTQGASVEATLDLRGGDQGGPAQFPACR